MYKVIAFDLFGTVLDASTVPHEEKLDYIRQIQLPYWQPLKLPKTWKDIKPFEDSARGIERLRKYYKVVTCSNLPFEIQNSTLGKNGILFDRYILLEEYRVYKPKMVAYAAILDQMQVEPREVLFVTGNNSYDLTFPLKLGIMPMRIRDEGFTRNITDICLPEML